MKKKIAFAVVFYSHEAFCSTVRSSIFYEYFRDMMVKNTEIDLETYEGILISQDVLCMFVLQKARWYLHIRDKDIPRYSKLLRKLNTNVITRSIFQVAVKSLLSKMPLNSLEMKELEDYIWVLNNCKD